MDVWLRMIAIFIEVVILALIMYVLLTGVRLILFDLGIGSKYNKMLTTVLIMGWVIFMVFVITHLTAFYPTV